jgi:hypothetical protein
MCRFSRSQGKNFNGGGRRLEHDRLARFAAKRLTRVLLHNGRERLRLTALNLRRDEVTLAVDAGDEPGGAPSHVDGAEAKEVKPRGCRQLGHFSFLARRVPSRTAAKEPQLWDSAGSRGKVPPAMRHPKQSDEELLAKIRSLPPDKAAEVEDFVEFLQERADRHVTVAASRAAEPSFAKVWDNADDAAYDAL